MLVLRSAWLVCFVLSAGCSNGVVAADAGFGADAVSVDTGLEDGAADAALLVDAAALVDAAPLVDAAALVDAGALRGRDAVASAADIETYDAPVPDGGPAEDGMPDAGEVRDATVESLPIVPIATCRPSGGCSGSAVQSALASYRKDFYYPYGPGIRDPLAFGTDQAPTYPEARIADPLSGGRVTFVGRAAVAGSLLPDATLAGASDRTAFWVEIQGRRGSEALDAGFLDWVRVWPPTFQAGDPIWVMFHSRDAAFDRASSLSVRVPSTGGDALNATVALALSRVALTSVSSSEDGRVLTVHLRNEDQQPHRVTRVIVDGEDVTAEACLASPELASGDSRRITVPRCNAYALGAPWTVAVEFADAPAVVGAGRVLKPIFPLHTWPSDADCPFPGINTSSFQTLRAQGFNTIFARANYGQLPGCSARSTAEAIEQDFTAAGAWALLDDFGIRVTDSTRVLGRLLGDEVDDQSLSDLASEQKMRRMAEETTYWSVVNPDVATYIGGSRSRHNGLFAGAADLQGMDFYIAGCAPHITDFGRHPPLRASYDYLRATHQNQRPGPTWLYTQGLGDWPGQPTPSEYRIQALSVLAAGAHGLMTFQTRLDRVSVAPDTWDEMGRVQRDIAALAPLLREGAPTGAARVTQGRAIVEALRVRGGMVLVVIGLETTQGPTDLRCALGRSTPWVLASQTIDVELRLPDDVGLTELLELRDGQLQAWPGTVSVQGRVVLLTGIQLEDSTAGRLLVLGEDGTLAAEIAARL